MQSDNQCPSERSACKGSHRAARRRDPAKPISFGPGPCLGMPEAELPGRAILPRSSRRQPLANEARFHKGTSYASAPRNK